MKDNLIYIAVVLLCLVAGFVAGRVTRKSLLEPVVEVKTDTLVVRDTVRLDRPVYITQRVVDSIYVPVTDTLRLHDTTFMVLPRQQREYRDTLYHAWVSGYDPALDSIDIFRKERYVTVEVTKTVMPKPKKWHVGVSAGYGACLLNETPVLSPYLGIGITYSIFSF